MHLRTLFIIAISAIAVLALACDGDDDNNATPSRDAGTNDGHTTAEVTYNGTDCLYDGPDTLPVGPATFTVVNDSSVAPGLLVYLWQIDEGHTFAEFSEVYAAQAHEGAGVNIQSFPSWTRVIGGTGGAEIDTGDSFDFDATLSPGTYAMDCETILVELTAEE